MTKNQKAKSKKRAADLLAETLEEPISWLTQEERQAALWWYFSSTDENRKTILDSYRMENGGTIIL